MSINSSDPYLRADWPAPSNVRAYSTTRIGGNSATPFSQFNLAHHVGDSPDNVSQNRARLLVDLQLQSNPLWLDQIHSSKVVNANCIVDNFAEEITSIPVQADASYSTIDNQVCVVMTADCLPILFTSKTGSWVAATHAGWRGLAGGIIQNTISAYTGHSSELIAWMGPAISQAKFEVGTEVKEQFVQINSIYSAAFIKTNNGKYRCDLYAIAKMILTDYQIDSYGGDFCTFSDDSRFYSYRRAAQTGRMASLIWIENVNADSDFAKS